MISGCPIEAFFFLGRVGDASLALRATGGGGNEAVAVSLDILVGIANHPENPHDIISLEQLGRPNI